MKELISFLKGIFMINETDSGIKVGLSQFKDKVEEPVKKVAKIQHEIKLSDLMRKSA